eukprot:Awhi_evm1s7624
MTANLQFDKCAQLIVPRLYLGSGTTGYCDIQQFKERNVTHVLVVGDGLAMRHTKKLTYLNIPIHDHPSTPVLPYLDQCMQFIESVLENDNDTNCLLVHCAAGISRSAAVVTCYLMKSRRWSLAEAVATVQQKRSVIDIKTHLMDDLKTYEENGFQPLDDT